MLFAYYLFMQFIARINVVFATQTLPTVDLGYETHRAISYDVSATPHATSPYLCQTTLARLDAVSLPL